MKALNILTATLGATVIGIGLGILFAPNKGSKTRDKISKKRHEYTDYLMDGYDDIMKYTSRSIDSVEKGASKAC
jgi:gas vesicle protein